MKGLAPPLERCLFTTCALRKKAHNISKSFCNGEGFERNTLQKFRVWLVLLYVVVPFFAPDGSLHAPAVQAQEDSKFAQLRGAGGIEFPVF